MSLGCARRYFYHCLCLLGKEEVLIKSAKNAKVVAPRTAKVGEGNEVENFKIGTSRNIFLGF